MGILTGTNLCLGQDSVQCSSFRAQRIMANDNKPLKDRDANATGTKKMKPPTERPFDMWLEKQLHAMYDEITAEPLPEDLTNLIELDAEKDKSSGKE
jgi:hypothetical protein